MKLFCNSKGFQTIIPKTATEFFLLLLEILRKIRLGYFVIVGSYLQKTPFSS